MSATMQALVVVEPNRMEVHEVPVPTPGRNEVLARVRWRAATTELAESNADHVRVVFLLDGQDKSGNVHSLIGGNL